MADGFMICATCGVEHSLGAEICRICADERQYVPRGEQVWTSLAEMRADGVRVTFEEVEPNLWSISTEPGVGIGHRAFLVVTPGGNVLWDPVGFIDDDAVRRIEGLGGVRAIVASHPHMFGVQLEWSRALGDAPVLVSSADQDWLARDGAAIVIWDRDFELVPGLRLIRVGGHFPGSAVIHWADGAEGRGVLLGSDSIGSNPDGRTACFMRSFPNRIPLSVKAVENAVAAVRDYPFERMYANFNSAILEGADEAVRMSARRHIDWITGRHDDLI